MRRLFALIGMLALVVLSGCSDTDSGRGNESVYRHSMDGAPVTLDPAQSSVVYTSFVVVNVYDTLFSFKYLARPYELKLNLAQSWPDISEDGKVYTIKIKPGVHFIDDPAFPDGKGRELVAADVSYSLLRHFDPSVRAQGAWLWQGRIEGLEEWKAAGANYDAPPSGLTAIDSHTLQIKLNEPYPQLLFTLAQGFAGIVPREAVEHYGRQFATHPVGSGPFMLDRFSTTKAVLVRNPDFRQEPFDLEAEGYDPAVHDLYGVARFAGQSPPFVDRIEIDFVEETAARWNSFTKGREIQFTNVPREQADSVLASRNPITLESSFSDQYHALIAPEAGFVYSGFNMADEAIGYHPDPTRNERNRALRCAIRSAFDWEERNRTFYFGIGQVFPGIITPVVPEFDQSMSRGSVTQNVAAAKKLLADHGWTPENIPTLEYGSPSNLTNRQQYEQFRGFLEQIGVPTAKVKLKSFPTFGDFNRAMKKRELMIFSLGWVLDYPDAENTLQLFYGPNETPGSNNFNYTNSKFDEMFDQTKVMQPSPERTALYREMNQMIVDECVALTGLSRTRIYLWHKNVIGFPDREIVGGYWLRYVGLDQKQG